MNKKRCSWCVGDPIYEAYHDKEWGRDVREDSTLFEFLTQKQKTLSLIKTTKLWQC